MANIYCFKRINNGAVLITALLFLLVLTLLAVSILRTSLLETKMSNNYHDKILAFKNAEKKLANQEKKHNASEIIAKYCGVTFYRIFAESKYKTASSKLQSTYAIVGDTSHCHPKPNIHTGRQSWREL